MNTIDSHETQDPRGILSAATLLDALPPALVVRVLRLMDPACVRRILHVNSDPDLSDRTFLLNCIEEFEATFRSSQSGRAANAKTRINKSSHLLYSTDQQDSSFGFLDRATPRTRIELLQEEHPKNIAIVLSTLTPVAASETLSGLDEALRFSVVKRLCELEEISNDDVMQLRYQLLRRMKRLSILHSSDNHQLEFATKLISCCDADEQEKLLSYFEQADPDLSRLIQKSLVSFDHLFGLGQESLRRILRYVDTSWWAPSLKNASTEKQQIIFRIMAPAAVDIVLNEMDGLGNVASSDQAKARQGIVQVMIHLAEEGMIDLHHSSESESTARRFTRAA